MAESGQGNWIQLSEMQEGFIKGLLVAGTRFEDAQRFFQQKYNRKISLSVISRISNRSKKIKRENNNYSKCTTDREDRILLKSIRENRWLSWEQIKAIVERDYGIHISAHTIQRRAHENGIFARPAKKNF